MKKVFKKYLSLILTSLFTFSTAFIFTLPKVLAADTANYSTTNLNIPCDYVYNFEDGLGKFKSGNFYGFIGKDGTVKTAAEFTAISSFKNGYAKAAKGSKFGFINTDGKVVVQPQFDDVSDFFENGVAAVCKNSKWGLINSSGKIITEPQYDVVYGFYDGFMRVRKGTKYGFLKSDGSVLLECNYDNAYDFNDEYAAVKKGTVWELIDKSGNFKSFDFDEIKSPALGMVPVKKDNLWGLSDINGKIILEPKYTNMSALNDNLIKVSSGGKYGALDKTAHFVLNLSYDSIIPTNNGMFEIIYNGKHGIIDATGKIIVKPQFDWIDTFQEGKAIVSSGDKYSFVDAKGEITHESQFDKVYAFQEGMAKVEKDNKFGFINSKGDTVIDPVFEDASDFHDGYAVVEKNTNDTNIKDFKDSSYINKYVKWGYIDRNGSNFIYYDFESASNFDNGCALTVKNDNCNMIKIANTKIVPNTITKDPFKTWKIKFSKAIDTSKTRSNKDDTVLNDIDDTMTDNIGVTDSSGNYVNVSFTFESPNTIAINPPSEGYKWGEKYTITMLGTGKYNIRDIEKNSLKPDVTKIYFQVLK